MRIMHKTVNMKISLMIAVFFTVIFLSTTASALSYESEQGLSFTLNPTIRITLSSDTMTINDLAPGTTSDSNIIKVTAESNAVAGYTLSSTVGNNTTYNTTNMLHTNGTNTFTNLSSNKATLANFDPSTWGYSYATCTTTECTNAPSWISGDITGTTNSGYNGLPLYTTSNPIKLINTTTPGSSAIRFKFGAKADTAQLAGTYANVINFIGVGKIITTSYTINFNDPSGEATSMPASQTGTSDNGAVQISSTQPTRTNYIFKGWCTESTSDDTCSGDTVQPGGMLALHPGTSNLTPTVTRTLYAMWGSNIAKTYMQDMTSTDCTTTATTVYDNRDEEPYLVQRLADGKCWMLDNLRLDLTNSTILNGLTTTNTHVNDASLTSLKSGNRSAGAQYASSGFVAWAQGDTNNVYNQAKANADYKDTTTTSYGSGSGKIGVYYNYCAASAGSYCYDSGNGTGNASYDLCPAGWRMPTGSSSGEYQALYTAYSSNVTNFLNALSTPLSGYFYDGSARYQGSDGYFWSSTYNGGNFTYDLYVTSSNVFPADSYSRDRGLSLRCLLR